MASNRQLLADGLAKRADLVKIRLEEIHVEPDFNAPETPEEFDARVESLVAHLESGGAVPPVEVRDRAEGGVWLVDGHARRESYKRGAERGLPLADPKDGHVYLLTIPFKGNDFDRNMRIITSANGRRLSSMQTAAILKRNRNLGQSAAEMAKAASLSVERVNQLLALADANSDVQNMVKSGEVSASVAAKAARKHKDNAGTVLKADLEQAKKEGKTKLTEAAVAPKKVKASDLAEERARLDWLVEQRAIVTLGGRMDLSNPQQAARNGYWVHWPDDEKSQEGVYETARAAIDAARTEAATQQ